ncbi:MAG: penicillin-binding protein 2 [Opitutaceae bacterium]|jgi:cell division protein FtsI/penicillin-binding protein 2
MRRGFASNYRIVLLTVVVGLCFAGLAARLVNLHVLDREHLLKMITKARTNIIVENARRGDIRDLRGNILATSKTQVILGVDPQMLRPEDEGKWPQLAELIGVPLADLRRVFTTKTRAAGSVNSASIAKVDEAGELRFEFKLSDDPEKNQVANEVVENETDDNGLRKICWAKLKENLEESAYDQVLKLDIKGVYGNRVYRRAYPHNSLAAHIVGYVNKEGDPMAGVEGYADFYLRGQDGWVVSEKDGNRREMAQFRTREVVPVDGYNVILSLDAVVQDIVEDELKGIAETFHPLKATIIVSDARSGFILGLGNYPTFNLSEYGKADIASMKNIAVTDVLEPGSVFKIVASSGALDQGLVTPESRFDCSIDSIVYKGKPRSLPKDDHKADHVYSVREILSRSSNRGAAQLAMRLGDEKFYEYMKAFGFGETTGFNIGGEVRGVVHEPKDWSGSDITRMPMGHSVSGTPLQIHYAMGTIASGGELLRPQVIREIRDSGNEVVFRYEGVVARRVIAKRTAEQMAGMLKWTTIKGEGTAPEAGIPGFEVAGKTGTTQKIKNGKYSNRQHVASFVGFFPASRPEIVISVIVDEATTNLPLGVAYGNKVAAPSFKHIGEKLIQYLNIKPVVETPRSAILAMEGGRR